LDELVHDDILLEYEFPPVEIKSVIVSNDLEFLNRSGDNYRVIGEIIKCI